MSLAGFAADAWGFFAQNLPGPSALILGGPPSLAWAWISLYFAGYLKAVRNWPTGYTRKVFHFLIFGTVALLQAISGSKAVCLFGAACSLVIFYALFKGDGHRLYEAMAREKDAPRRGYFIIVPYLSTLIGGLVSNILWGSAALTGYLVAGLGDAMAEPVGTRWGRHPYPVPSLKAVPATRSLEGSGAVFAVSIPALALGIYLSPELCFGEYALAWIAGMALVCCLLEAVSPHGWDNALLQIAPAFMAKGVFGS